MGPLFALALLAFVGCVATLAIFVRAKFFLPIRSALLISLVVAGAGIGGGIIGLLVQAPFLPKELTSTFSVIRFLAIGGLTGLTCAVLAAVVFLKLRSKMLAKISARSVRSYAQTFD
jgi:hypothetical protein